MDYADSFVGDEILRHFYEVSQDPASTQELIFRELHLDLQKIENEVLGVVC